MLKQYLTLILLLLLILLAACNNASFVENNDENLNETEKVDENVFAEELEEELNEEESLEEIDFDTFIGTYVQFLDKPYKSAIVPIGNVIELNDESYSTYNYWDYFMTSTIIKNTVEENILTIDVESDENEMWGLHSETGTETFTLEFEEGMKTLKYNDDTYYSLTEKDMKAHYDEKEQEYSRVMISLIGHPPATDSWGVVQYAREKEGLEPVFLIKNETDNNGNEITTLALDIEFIYVGEITYSVIDKDTIEVYHENGQKEEMNLDGVEIYDIANFIGNLAFIYE